MSRTTETLHVRGVRRVRMIEAIEARMNSLGFARVESNEDALPVDTASELRRLVLRRDGRWLTLADPVSFSGFAQFADSQIDAWGQHLSKALGRSVLGIWTWDGEASVSVKRWKNGERRRELSLLREAYRGPDGLPYAPAKVLWPWLPPDRRNAILRTGVKLVAPPQGTGGSDIDVTLEEEIDGVGVELDSDDDLVFVSEDVSVAAIGAAVGMRAPFLDPGEPDDDTDLELLFSSRSRPRPRTH